MAPRRKEKVVRVVQAAGSPLGFWFDSRFCLSCVITSPLRKEKHMKTQIDISYIRPVTPVIMLGFIKE